MKGHEFKRNIEITKIKALTKSTVVSDLNFVIHVEGDYDYQINCANRDQLFETIKRAYMDKMNTNLPIYGVPDKVKNYCTSKSDAKAGKNKVPIEMYRLVDED